MLLVLAHSEDRVAQELVERAAATGVAWGWLRPADLVTARWNHQLDGGVTTSLVTANGSPLDIGNAVGVLNRLTWLPPVALSRPEDREYALAEQHALLISVLASIPAPVVNPTRPPSLAGPVLDPAGWLALATKCSIPARRMRATTNARRWSTPGWQPLPWQSVTTVDGGHGPPVHAAIPIGPRPMVWAQRVAPGPVVTVVGPHVFGAPDHRWQDHCLRLASAAGSPLLQVSLGAVDRTWVMVGAETSPPGLPPAAYDALLDLLVTGVPQARGTDT